MYRCASGLESNKIKEVGEGVFTSRGWSDRNHLRLRQSSLTWESMLPSASAMFMHSLLIFWSGSQFVTN